MKKKKKKKKTRLTSAGLTCRLIGQSYANYLPMFRAYLPACLPACLPPTTETLDNGLHTHTGERSWTKQGRNSHKLNYVLVTNNNQTGLVSTCQPIQFVFMCVSSYCHSLVWANIYRPIPVKMVMKQQ